MKGPTRRPALDRLHQHTRTKRTAKRTAHAPTLSEPEQAQTVARAEDYPIGHFGPQHGLTPAQAWDAQQLLRTLTPREQKAAERVRGVLR